ncbi:Uma2 family endonuclease [Chamaesiphon sp. GL140_3_metabinner_50]|uniref:Uma2 family endonuclease n=1 Tax=Chamaesiphon sp. GL140_3_metabinner_50 TaxID=2970812 RepID=UPI0025F29E6C|nr:Uma2 family endonuclease [Chamaesiphon sp. GL140_3_metabinner_50]
MQLLETKPLLLDIHNITLRITHQEFEQLCQDNPDLRLELAANGELIVMAPAGYESSEKNSDLTTDVNLWNRQTKLGRVFDSSGGFTLPNGAIRSPDVTWIEKSKLRDVPAGVKFPQVIPDFAIELRSDTDSPEERLCQRMSKLREKMEEYRASGVRLGWPIDPQKQQVEIYRLGQDVEVLQSPTSLSGEDVLPGFTLDLGSIFK